MSVVGAAADLTASSHMPPVDDPVVPPAKPKELMHETEACGMCAISNADTSCSD
jgi:hypothetical protein